MILKGSKLSASNAFFATFIAGAVMILPFISYVVISDSSFVPESSFQEIVGEMIGFAALTAVFFIFPVSLIASLVAKIYSATLLKKYNLPMPTLLLIAGALGTIATTLWALVSSIIFFPIGFFGGVLAGLLFYRFQTGRWS